MFLPLRDENPTASTPYLTYALIVANTAVFLVEVVLGDEALGSRIFPTWGAVPAELLADPVGRAPSLVTSMFLHGGWLHLIGNMWFLYIFGDNVEDRLGKPLFLLFYLASGLGATALQVAVAPGSTIPMVGASGAIAGVLGAYALVYPRARVVTLLWLFIFVRLIRIPAVAFLGIWFGMQFLSGLGSLGATGGGTAWWAHVGGFAVGGAVGYFLRWRDGRPRVRKLHTPGPNRGVIIRLDPDRRRPRPRPRDPDRRGPLH